jgi:hypothetical protein
MTTAIIDLTALIIPFAVGCVGLAGIVFAVLFTLEMWSGARRASLDVEAERPTRAHTFRPVVRSRVVA